MIYLYGAGGHGKVVLDTLQNCGLECHGFIDDRTLGQWAGLPVIQPSSIPSHAQLHLAIGNSQVREKLAQQLIQYQFLTIRHPQSSISKSAQVSSDGCLIAAKAVIGPDAKIGNHTIVNHGAIVDHDCIVGDYCHIAPNAVLGGNVRIGNHVLIGAGAVVLPGITIIDNVTVGAGAVVTRDITDAAIFVGAPAKPIDYRTN